MKLNTQQRSVSSSGMCVSVGFSIDMNPKSFSVLSDGMYSDIVSTIVRELSSNCYDAHVAANKLDVPFDVYCPTAFDPHFGVKDNGTGISYYAYTGTVVNKFDGESDIFIVGDIRDEVKGISMVILDGRETIKLGNVLYDSELDQTILRIPGNWEGDNVSVEFDNMLVLYSTYFLSTKEQSNDFIGAYGLGSKTPLAYTDNFIVVNRFNGISRTYNIIKNQEGQPQINLMVSCETDECNGLEVKLAVDPYDYDEFKTAIQTQLKYFSPPPTIHNEVVALPVVQHVGKNFILMQKTENTTGNEGYYYRSSAACSGNNAYNIKHVVNKLFCNNLVLKFAVGEVMVTASREEFKYDDATIDLIKQREHDAIAEYIDYVLSTIDTTTMVDYEKAAFLNDNSDALDLSSLSVRNKVGNSQYTYNKNKISIPLSGWGDYSELPDVPEDDDSGVLARYRGHRTNNTLCWTQYNGPDIKSNHLVDVHLTPLKKSLVFIRDVRHAFLKKINQYMESNNISIKNSGYQYILILDQVDTPQFQSALDSIRDITGNALTFVNLSDIQLPKTFTMSSSDRSITPTARLFQLDSTVFNYPKMWKDVYDPLTKIDTDAYIVQTHHCAIENVLIADKNFFTEYLTGGFPIDKNIVVLAMSRAKYEKALTYGFKPITDLIARLKRNLVIPVDIANYIAIQDGLVDKVLAHDVLDLFTHFTPDEWTGVNPSSLVARLNRVGRVITKRYVNRANKYDAMRNLLSIMDNNDSLVPSPTVVAAIDKVSEMCDNLSTDMRLIESQRSYSFRTPEMKNALLQYVNMLYPTGESV